MGLDEVDMFVVVARDMSPFFGKCKDELRIVGYRPQRQLYADCCMEIHVGWQLSQ
jgi:hypothetical protein